MSSKTKEKIYSILLWNSDPDEGNDDCMSGDDVYTREEALEIYNNPEQHFSPQLMRYTVFVELDGPDIYAKRRIAPDLPRDDDDDWRREQAMQAGMGLGVDAYNDYMGYGYTPWEDDEIE